MVVREGRPLPGLSRRAKATIGVVTGVIVLFMLLGTIVDLWTDILWYREVEFTQVFTGVLFARAGLFAAFGVGMALIVALNLWLAFRLRPLLRPHSPEQASLERYRMLLTPRIGLWIALVGGVVGLFAGLTAQGRWPDWMLFRHGGEFNWSDPQLGVNAGFYVFQYPFIRFLLGVGFAVVVLSLIGALAMYYLYGAVRLQGVGDRITTAARAHLSILVASFIGLKAVAYWLDRRSLMLEYNEPIGLYGAGSSGVNAMLGAKEMLMWIAIIVAVAVLVFANAVFRNLTYPGASLALLVLAAVVIGGIYPWGVQTFDVNPTLRDKEEPYIERSIEATRYAFGLDNTEMTPYPGTNETPPEEMADDETLRSAIRLLDPEILPQTYTQLQQVRGFYGFGEKLDVVRYNDADGEGVTDYVVGLRQISDDGLTDQQRQWQNRHSYYSHGYGMVAAPAAEIVCNGRPFFVSGFLGTADEEAAEQVIDGDRCRRFSDLPELSADQPRVYYGDEMNDYVVVGGRDEFDRPTATGDDTYVYTGDGGVDVGSFGRKLLYAIHFRETNFILSEVVNPESRVLYDREPRTRVEKVAPFLTVDGDPYPVVVDGRIVWIVDAYTTAETFPYSQRINLQQETTDAQVGEGTVAQLAQEDVSYMRNAVKATVDAYDGTVTLYEFDEEDPVLDAWNSAFGGDLVVPKAETPPELMEHFRYPQDMFKVQRNLLQRFYVENPGEFFAGTDFWEVPNTPANPDSPFVQPPYYLLTQFPGQDEPTFQLTSAVSPVDRLNLAAVISGAYNDGELQLEAWQLPDDTRIPGPVQVHQDMTNAAHIRERITLLEGSARVTYGNLLSLPYEDGMLYIEPVYVQTTAAEAFPLMQLVLMSYGEYVTLSSSVEEGLEDLVEQGRGQAPTLPDDEDLPLPEDEAPPEQQAPPTDPPAQEPPPDDAQPPADLEEAQARMEAAEEELVDAYQSGDLNRLATALEEWSEARDELQQAEGQAGED
ncbi:UPF0182 family protein [Natronosporangium hydrolyticum]|uniref:UPF0182 family protein n=1 Tax=Natronosporangium hydrolyticum TaxID=2811111 RepID=A0A895YNH3_9ACTN|nr:UPF0182 family protein [Natronosporangium hydrolyticum]QSB15670.1 UPF0182 family protein [Natronosporangium hydrolyticum]